MSLSAYETAVLNFGREVLRLMELQDEWGADTLQDISDIAASHNLTEADAGEFRVVSAARFGQA